MIKQILDIDINNYTEQNFMKARIPMKFAASSLSLYEKYNLCLHNFSLGVDERFNSPVLRFDIFGELTEMNRLRKDTNCEPLTDEEIKMYFNK